MQRILLIEDSVEYQTLVRGILAGPGVEVVIASTAAEGLEHVQGGRGFDLILLDVGLPDQDGFAVCARIRADASTQRIPVVFLTGSEDIGHKITAFSLGAEDYIVKPFHPLELKARIEAKMKKARDSRDESELLVVGSLRIHVPLQRVCVIDGAQEKDLGLTPIEFKLLCQMVRHEEHVFSRAQLLEKVWGPNVHVFDRTVDTHISGLRKKLGHLSECIQSVSGVGYRFSQERLQKKSA